jgi:hypothetical protein
MPLTPCALKGCVGTLKNEPTETHGCPPSKQPGSSSPEILHPPGWAVPARRRASLPPPSASLSSDSSVRSWKRASPVLRAVRQSCLAAESAELSCQRGRRIVGIEAARVRQNPYLGLSETGLATNLGVGCRERSPVTSDPQEGEPLGSKRRYPVTKIPSAVLKLTDGDLRRPRRWSPHNARDAQPQRKQLSFVRGTELTWGEPRSVKRRPKPVTRSGEVVSVCYGREAGVDSRENDGKPVGDDVMKYTFVEGELSIMRRNQHGFHDLLMTQRATWRLQLPGTNSACGDLPKSKGCPVTAVHHLRRRPLGCVARRFERRHATGGSALRLPRLDVELAQTLVLELGAGLRAVATGDVVPHDGLDRVLGRADPRQDHYFHYEFGVETDIVLSHRAPSSRHTRTLAAHGSVARAEDSIAARPQAGLSCDSHRTDHHMR